MTEKEPSPGPSAPEDATTLVDVMIAATMSGGATALAWWCTTLSSPLARSMGNTALIGAAAVVLLLPTFECAYKKKWPE